MTARLVLFVILLLGTAAAGALLVLHIPSMFDSAGFDPQRGALSTAGVLAVVVLALAVGARIVRPGGDQQRS